jgi:hypothetical protein
LVDEPGQSTKSWSMNRPILRVDEKLVDEKLVDEKLVDEKLVDGEKSVGKLR